MACMTNHQCAWLSIGLGLLLNAHVVEGPDRQNPAPAACEVSRPTATFSIAHRTAAPELNTDPNSPAWRNARSAWIEKDCSREVDYPDLKTEPVEAKASGDKVFVWLRFSGHGAESNLPIEMELAHVITMRDRKWARTVEYADKAQALEAAGLRE